MQSKRMRGRHSTVSSIERSDKNDLRSSNANREDDYEFCEARSFVKEANLTDLQSHLDKHHIIKSDYVMYMPLNDDEDPD